MKNLLLFLLFQIACFQFLNAQFLTPTVVSSLGGAGNNSAFTVGDLSISTYSSSDLIVTQGFQQSNLLTDDGTPDNVNELKDVGFKIKVFPNPAKDKLIIKIDELKKGDIQLHLMDLKGRNLKTLKIERKDRKKTIYLGNFPSGIYLLKATYRNKSNIYKIVKH